MSEKTLGQIAYESLQENGDVTDSLSFIHLCAQEVGVMEKLAQAVIEAHEERKLQPPKEL